MAKKRKKQPEYFWCEDGRIGKLDAQKAGRVIFAQQGKHSAEKIERAARSPIHEFHDYLEQDNEIAGPKYRTEQIRFITRMLRRKVKDKKGKKHLVRAFININYGSGEVRPYDYVMEDKELREDYLGQSAIDAARFIRKYEHLVELASPIKALAKFIKKRSKKDD